MFKRKRKSNGEEIRKLVYNSLMLNREILSWHQIRSLCTDNETTDLICAQIQNEHGIKIVYNGVVTKF